MSTEAAASAPEQTNTQKLADEFRERIDARLAELQGAVDEHNELSAMKASLNTGTPRATRSRASSGNTGTRRAPGGGQTRQEELVAIVRQHPEGITIADAAAQMEGDIKTNYLYRVHPKAQAAGELRMGDDGKLYPLEPVAAAS